MSEGLLAQAGEILVEAQELHRRGVWSLVVRRSQEVVELALKAALRAGGVEVPKIHDVGTTLKGHQARFPEHFRKEIDRLASISRRLRHERETSFYGDEETDAPPQRLYSEEDAHSALAEARDVFDLCRTLSRGLGPESG